MNKTDTGNNKGWILHLLIVIAMYVYYLSLWYNYIFYDGKAGWKEFGMFVTTYTTAPVYFIFHVAAFFISRSNGFKKDVMISLAGLAALIIHVCAFALTI